METHLFERFFKIIRITIGVFARKVKYICMKLIYFECFFFQMISICSAPKKSEIIMTSRVIHSLPLKMSAIQIFQDSKMVAISHLVGLDQLPQQHQDGVII